MTSAANPSAFETWNGEHGLRWVASADRRDRVLAPAADALLDAARPAVDEHVLDIGCGCGVTTLMASTSVGAAGSVLGVDISAPMLDVARRRAGERDASNTDFVRADAQVHAFEPSSVDLVISRFGTMFFSDPTAAFANIGSALRAGGRLCVATWRPLAANQWLAVPAAALLELADPEAPPPGESAMFAQSDADTVLAILDAAGFTDIALAASDLAFTLGEDVDDAVEFVQQSGPMQARLDTIPEGPSRDAALEHLPQSLAHFDHGSGVHMSAGIWIVTATRD